MAKYWSKKINNIYVYSHALIIEDEILLIKFFYGFNKEVQSKEKEIYEFIKQNLLKNNLLYACNHYLQQYPSIENLIYMSMGEKKIPREVEHLFVKVHTAAKNTAKQKFYELLNEHI